MLNIVQFMSARCLVRARIRADAAAMLLQREWWQSLGARDDVSVYVFCDSSPQWRGVELFACTVDIVVGDELFRRLSPLVSLNKSQLDLSGKMAALLWQAFLLTGPAWKSLNQFCQKVRSVTTDMGTERLLADCPSCLAEFFAVASPGEKVPEHNSASHLFGNAMHEPGFWHLVDNVLQRGLSSLKGFPGFLAKLKSIVKFLRSELVMDEICRCLERDGCSAHAQSVLGVLRSLALGDLGASHEGLGHLPRLVCGALRPNRIRRPAGHGGVEDGGGRLELCFVAPPLRLHLVVQRPLDRGHGLGRRVPLPQLRGCRQRANALPSAWPAPCGGSLCHLRGS